MIKRFIRPALSILFPLLKGVLFDIPKYGRHKEKYEMKVRHDKFKKLFIKVNKALRVKYIVLGKENIPNEASLFVPNHLSASDPLILYPIIDNLPTTYVGKIELEKIGVIKDAVNAIDGLFMDREDLRQSLKVMQKVEKSLKEDKNLNWVIFAEGKRVLDYSSLTRDMHHGTFRPAFKAKAPIVPVAIYGSQILLKDKPIYKTYPFIISFLKPIYPDEYENMTTEEISKIVESRIRKELSFNLRRIHHEEMLKYNKNKYRLNRIVD